MNEPTNIFTAMLGRVRAAVDTLMAEGALPPGLDHSRVVVEPPREASHGDMATNAAMVLAKPAGRKPREIADAIADKLRGEPSVLEASVAGPGFINLTLRPDLWRNELRAAVRAGDAFGRSEAGRKAHKHEAGHNAVSQHANSFSIE